MKNHLVAIGILIYRDLLLGHTDYSDKMCLILRTMKIKVKEGPCGEVKMPRAQTLDDIPREKSVSSNCKY